MEKIVYTTIFMENVNPTLRSSTPRLRLEEIDGERSRTINRKKILFIVTQSEMGGAQRYVYEVARLLDKNRYEVLVAAGGDGEFFEKLHNINIKTIQLKQMRRTPWPWQITKSIWEICDLLKKERPLSGPF